MSASRCADCGSVAGGGVSLKACKPCMLVRYCNADCQRNHWPTHKKECKQRAAELRDEALFKDPPPKEECPICFVPMPANMVSCVSKPPATITSVPVHDFANDYDKVVNMSTEIYYNCCGKSNCHGCDYSFFKSGNYEKCPFCNSDRKGKTEVEAVQQIMKRVNVNDTTAMCNLAIYYNNGQLGFQQDHAKARQIHKQAAELGSSRAHCHLGHEYHLGGD